jgi:hypothetical protein
MVRSEIYDDLIGLGSIPRDAGWAEAAWSRYGTKVQQLWKTSKVALNPPDRFALHLECRADATLRRSSAARAVAHSSFPRDRPKQHYQIAKKYGITVKPSALRVVPFKRDLLELEREMRGNHPLLAIQRWGFHPDKASDTYQLSETIESGEDHHAMERRWVR